MSAWKNYLYFGGRSMSVILDFIKQFPLQKVITETQAASACGKAQPFASCRNTTCVMPMFSRLLFRQKVRLCLT